jgi:hypothetical protein
VLPGVAFSASQAAMAATSKASSSRTGRAPATSVPGWFSAMLVLPFFT